MVMKAFNMKAFGCAVCAVVSLAVCLYAQQAPRASSGAAPAAADDALLAQGRAIYVSETYRCSVCHGEKGEGADGPDLIGSLLTEDQITRFLQKPSVLATSRGMPSIPANSPDLKPLSAYVFSLQGP